MDNIIINYLKINGDTELEILFKHLSKIYLFPKITQVYYATGGLSENQDKYNQRLFWLKLKELENKNLISIFNINPPMWNSTKLVIKLKM